MRARAKLWWLEHERGGIVQRVGVEEWEQVALWRQAHAMIAALVWP